MSFKDRAKEWDNDKRIKRSKIIADKINDIIGKQQNFSIMEYGCATGLISFNLCKNFKKLTLMDSEDEMINTVKEKIITYKTSNVFANKVDLTKENYTQEKFNVIYTSLTLHHIKDIEDIIKKFYNLLNKNGILCIIELDKDDGSFHMNSKEFNGHNGFEHHYMENILKSTGFSNVKSETFFHDIKNNIPYSLFYTIAYK